MTEVNQKVMGSEQGEKKNQRGSASTAWCGGGWMGWWNESFPCP